MKTCTKCHMEKPLTDFYKSKHTKDGHQWQCKKCKAKEDHDYKRKNAAKWAAYMKSYYAKNPDKYEAFKRYLKEYRKKKKDV